MPKGAYNGTGKITICPGGAYIGVAPILETIRYIIHEFILLTRWSLRAHAITSSTSCLELHHLVEQLWPLVYHQTFQDLPPPQNQAQPK